MFEYFETALITGPHKQLPADGITLLSPEFAQRQLDLELETACKLREWGHNSDRAHRLVLAQEAGDTVDLVNRVAAAIGFDLRPVVNSRETMTAFMLSLPAKGTICRLRMSAHKDQGFRWHIADLNDMTALGTAAGYCDVGAEKHWASILRRHATHIRARVSSNLLGRPELLLS